MQSAQKLGRNLKGYIGGSEFGDVSIGPSNFLCWL